MEREVVTCETCQGSEIEFIYGGHGTVLELPCSCVCVYDHQPGSPSFEGGAAFEAYQNQQERDLSIYGNSFTVDGVRVHPSSVRIESFKVPVEDGQLLETIEHINLEIRKVFSPSLPDDTYEIPQEIIDRISKSMDEMITKTFFGTPTPTPPNEPHCGCFGFLHRHACKYWNQIS